MIKRKCLVCKKEFNIWPYEIKDKRGIFCSRKCKGLWQSINRKGDKSTSWKGDKASYYAIHKWIREKLGKPKVCKHCGANNSERIIEWANINHSYSRILNDYMPLCKSCHTKYDFTEETRRKQSEAQRGKIISEETRRKISKALQGVNTWSRGIKLKRTI